MNIYKYFNGQITCNDKKLWSPLCENYLINFMNIYATNKKWTFTQWSQIIKNSHMVSRLH